MCFTIDIFTFEINFRLFSNINSQLNFQNWYNKMRNRRKNSTYFNLHVTSWKWGFKFGDRCARNLCWLMRTRDENRLSWLLLRTANSNRFDDFDNIQNEYRCTIVAHTNRWQLNDIMSIAAQLCGFASLTSNVNVCLMWQQHLSSHNSIAHNFGFVFCLLEILFSIVRQLFSICLMNSKTKNSLHLINNMINRPILTSTQAEIRLVLFTFW